MAIEFKPKNAAATFHIGCVDRVLNSATATDFVVLKLRDDAVVIGDGDPDKYQPGTSWRFLGKWAPDDRFGWRFRFSTALPHLGHGRTGVRAYLTRECEGIGEKTANRLFDRYGGEAVEILRTDPAKVAAECGLSLDLAQAAAEQLARSKRHEGSKVELFELFAGKGFSGKLIEAVLDKWGAKGPALIRRNPFALLGMPSAGFRRCDRLWTELKLPPNSLKRQALVAANAVRSTTAGHTWLTAQEVASKLRELVPNADPLRAFKFGLRARKLKKYRDAAGVTWLADYGRATAEERIVAAVSRLGAGAVLWPTDRVPVSAAEGDRLPTSHQVEKLGQATAGAVGLFLGGPGTGKTHTLAFLLRAAAETIGLGNIICCAPTGKAANRMTQALRLAGLDITARTIHGTLGVGANGHGGDSDGWAFEHNAENRLHVTLLVVDESSMIDATLLACLLDAMPTGANVLLVGDPYQLPPVGHGAPLRDLIDAGVPHGELTEVQRNAGQIVHACLRIKNGESFETTDRIDLEAKPPKNLKLLPARDAAHAREVLVDTLKRFTKFDPVWQTQVIVARNARGEICRKELNALLHPLLNPEGFAAEGNPFKVGDKIICTRNSWMHRVELFAPEVLATDPAAVRDAKNYEVVMAIDPFDGHPTRDPVEVFTANGEIGRVVAVAKGLTIARFSEGEALVKIPMGKERDADGPEADADGDSGRGCNFDHAYAITVHKAQGSEAPCVIVMADADGGGICDRAWWYTAISRAAKLCLLIGSRSVIDKQRLRLAIVRRKTFLKELVLEARNHVPAGD